MRNEQRKVITTFARCLCGLATAWTATSAAAAAVDSYRIGQLYSNQSGYSQFIELVEVAGQDGQDQLTGLTLKVTNRAGAVKTFVFTHDLPNPNTANRHVTIASQGLAYDLQFPECTSPCPAFGVTVDYVMPDLFLPTDGGKLELAAGDAWTFDALPTDGAHGLLRSGAIETATASTFAGQKVVDYYGPGVGIIEYYNAQLDQYFMSGSQPDLDALDSGRIPGWTRTGADFSAYSAPQGKGFYDIVGAGADSPVCRYYIPPGKGASHFYSAAADECDAVGVQHPDYVLETRAAFYAWLPDRATGHCPFECVVYGPCTQPVYRLWNNRPDSGHRFTRNRDVRDSLVDQGWVSEGYGPNGVAMCVL